MIAAGELVFSFDVVVNAGVAPGDYLVEFVRGSVKPQTGANIDLGSVAYSVIPEPMTMGLLGVGALFLRRRK